MANFLQTLIPILSFVAMLLMMLADETVSQKSSFYFDSFHSKPTDLTYQGHAHVPSRSSSLRLTKTGANGLPLAGSVGRVLYSKPVQFSSHNKILHFTTTIKFTITPIEGHYPADGLAFFIAPVGSTIPHGSSGGNLGLFNSKGSGNALFAVEVDLYTNEWDTVHDYHVGIDINSRYSSNVASFKEACLGQETRLYISSDGRMLVAMLACGADESSHEVEYEYDLSSFLPRKVQFGISAATGGSFALHDVSFWSFNSTMMHVPDQASKT